MSTVTTIPTLEQSCALAELVRHGEITQEHRYLIARLLDEIGTSVRVTAEGEQRYPGDSAAQDLLARGAWAPVGTEYVRVLGVVSPVATE